MIRLYRYHGSAQQATTVVEIESRDYQQYENPVPTFNTTRQFRTPEAAEQYAANHSNAFVGGVADFPRENVDALEHYRLVRLSQESAAPRSTMANLEFRQGEQPTWVKLFERVPGATVQGEAPANTTVTAQVQMAATSPVGPDNFTYTQYAETGPDGEFEMRVPYASTGYENWGPEEGHTNVSVRATGPYQFTTPTSFDDETMNLTRANDTVHVPEAAVIGEDEAAIQVTLEEQVVGSLGGNDDGAGNETATNDTASDGSTDGTTNSTDEETTTDTVESLIDAGQDGSLTAARVAE
jgi:dolichyl-diphosphooligosaccharide--protein glycosyltransferase